MTAKKAIETLRNFDGKVDISMSCAIGRAIEALEKELPVEKPKICDVCVWQTISLIKRHCVKCGRNQVCNSFTFVFNPLRWDDE